MQIESRIKSLSILGKFLKDFLQENPSEFKTLSEKLQATIQQSKIENPWFSEENILFGLEYWSNQLQEENLTNWLQAYSFRQTNKRVGLILAGNIPMVGFHDVISVLLSGNIPIIKLSSKDKRLIPFFLEFWKDIYPELDYELVERLEKFDQVIATGSNNSARYFEYYFKEKPHIIRKNRTSVAVLSGTETKQELELLADDIFRYFGLGCRNVTQLLVPEDYTFDLLFESFFKWKEIIHHNKYGNGYDYQKAIYLLNQDLFWDNNFVLVKESEVLFSPMATVLFKKYKNTEEISSFLAENEENIQCVVSKMPEIEEKIGFGETQNPSLNTYADGIDVMRFLEGKKIF